jgi:hypothetical protein
MDGLTFIAEWLKAASTFLAGAAWPIVFLICVFCFRTEIRGILGRLKSFKWGSAEAILDDDLDDAERAVSAGFKRNPPFEIRGIVSSEHADALSGISDSRNQSVLGRRDAIFQPDDVTNNADNTQAGAATKIVLAFQDIEAELRLLAGLSIVDPAGREVSISAVLQILTATDVLTKEQVGAILELQRLRDKVALNPDLVVTRSIQRAYADMAKTVLFELQNKAGLQR